ncbi:MAG: hypothetical protein IGR76_15490 [Synechococcales cyanobacterium T60_A2020_003]|nr:hypothetical protein [Synechococcales cyanobacterium T60_A2020_003]
MVDPMDNIAKQARQGSVAAIIQVLNDKLADSGVRTRAVFEKGILQLLCEAPTPEQLEQESLVEQLRQILESISPRSIRRVKINSRIVREQQLLWLEEINRDPEGQLLWSQDITLKQPNPVRRFVEDWRDRDLAAISTPTKPTKRSDKQIFWRGIIGGASLSLLALLLLWVLNDWLNLQLGQRFQRAIADTEESAPSASSIPTETPAVSPAPADEDPFVLAVRLAEQASQQGKTAQSAADWLDLASRWQRASDLMAQVPPEDPRYPTAQDRTNLYAQFSAEALKQAQTEPAPETP